MLISVNENATVNGTDIYERGIQINNVSQNTYQTLATANYTLGRSPDAGNPFWYNGKIAEIINYSTRLSDTDRHKVESYLALKYGITLQNGTQNYTASDGSTIIWNTSTAGVYTKGVFGIGRDTLQSLNQTQAKSVNPDAVITLVALGE